MSVVVDVSTEKCAAMEKNRVMSWTLQHWPKSINQNSDMTEAAIPFPIYRNRFIGVYPEARPSGNRQSDGAVLTHSPLPPTNLLPILINSFISFLKPAILKSCMNWPTSIRYFPIYRRPTIDGPENVGPCGRRTRKRDGTTWSRVLPFFFFVVFSQLTMRRIPSGIFGVRRTVRYPK